MSLRPYRSQDCEAVLAVWHQGVASVNAAD